MKVLILGGYGNFGKRIARLLTRSGVAVIVAGRDQGKADTLVQTLPRGSAETAIFDINTGLTRQLAALRPAVVVNTCGPFQESGYHVARACIGSGVHYIDLADGRDFVVGITALEQEARRAGVAVISGASTVPALTAAVIETYRAQFSEIHELTFGIAPGQKAERGLATTQAILSYVGRKLKPCAGCGTRYGWQDLYRQPYPEIGNRWMANCDVPDLDLLPKRYGIAKIRFSAGMENPLVHLGMWLMSWGVRLGAPVHLAKYASPLLKVSNWFDFIGSPDGGMHVILEGKDRRGKAICKKWFIVARAGDGPYIPAVPAVILSRKIVTGKFTVTGALPCVGLLTLQDYLQELRDFNIKTYEFD